MLSKKFTLLYVEDDLNTIEDILPILKSITKEVYVARDGEEALKIYYKYSPDLILTDIVMPGIDGISMAKEIKQNNPHQPIGVLTGFEEVEYLEKSIDVGIDKYILKPITNIQKLKNGVQHLAKLLQFEINVQKEQQLLFQQSKIDSIVDILSNIAHQWRQPLSIISSSASSIKLQKQFETLTDETLIQISEEIVRTTKHLSDVIDTFRNAFDSHSDKENVNLKHIIEQTINLLKAKFFDYKIDVNLRINDVTLNCCEHDIYQILLNILNNAKDSVLDLAGERLIFIKLNKRKDMIYLNILDNGGGIDKETMERIFEPYFTTKHQSQDKGLGLYVTREIIRNKLHGDISIENRNFTHEGIKYTGANFSIKIPLNI